MASLISSYHKLPLFVFSSLAGVDTAQGLTVANGVTQGQVLGPTWSSAVFDRILVAPFKVNDDGFEQVLRKSQ